jgi:outer membrane protein assembly factor BamB
MVDVPVARRVWGTIATSLVLVGSLAGSTLLIEPAGATARTAAVDYTWPKYGYNASDTGTSADPTVSAKNATTLGVKWMVPDQTQSESSPVVEYNATLGVNVVYQGNIDGGFTAFNASTGAIIWSTNLGSAVISTPLVADGAVWIDRSFSPVLYKLDAATGAVICQSAPLASFTYVTPTIATPPGGAETVYLGVNGIQPNAPLYAVDAATCATDWKFTAYNESGSGTWDPYSYAVDATGEGLVLFGTDNPDSTVYAIDAVTGRKVWSYMTQNVTEGDVGTAASITPPGVNGFADGAAYISNNGGYTYALDLTTGKPYWRASYAAITGSKPDRGTAAVIGNHVILPGPTGVICLNAVTGALIWKWVGPAPSDSAAAVSGPSGNAVVAVTDLAGNFDVLNASTGALLYQYQTGGYAVTSVAESDGNFYVASGSGFLYDFGLGGTAAGAGTPSTTITSPATGSTLANPAGSVTIGGTASGTPIGSVDVAIQSGGSNGSWWDAAAGSWSSGFVTNPATLGTPGAASTTWSASVPVPSGGGTYSVQASATGTDGLADLTAYSSVPSSTRTTFTVSYLASAPHLATTGGVYWVTPGSSVGVSGSGFDPGEAVAVSVGGSPPLSATAGPKGAFSGSVAVPVTDLFGVTAVTATGATSKKSTTTVVDISNQWQSSGDGSLHTGYENNDLTWDLHIVGNHAKFLTQAWSYPTGASISTQPTVVDDVAYVGNNAGTVTALDVQNSAPIWTFAAGSPVDTTVAVTDGLVVFGTTAGSVDAISQATGALEWRTAASSGVESSPSVADGKVFVGSDNGTVYALNQATGAVDWQTRMAGAVTGSPTVDPVTGVVVVGDSSGAISALHVSDGSSDWSVATGGPVTATPTIVNGLVYVGSQTGTVYALHEATGGQAWSYATGGAVSASGAYWASTGDGAPAYVVGNANGNLDFLAVATGKLDRQINQGDSPVTGVTCANDWAVASLANGLVFSDKFGGEITWAYQGTAQSSPVTLQDGVSYLTGQDGAVRAFTVPGTQIP